VANVALNKKIKHPTDKDDETIHIQKRQGRTQQHRRQSQGHFI
jgi:hypothetical protein